MINFEKKKMRSNTNLKVLIDGLNPGDIDRFVGILKDQVEAIDFTNLIMKNDINKS